MGNGRHLFLKNASRGEKLSVQLRIDNSIDFFLQPSAKGDFAC